MNKREFIIIILLISISSTFLYSQNKIKTGLEITFSECEKGDTITMFPFVTSIKERICLNNYPTDTLQLKLEYSDMYYFYQYFFPRMRIFSHSVTGLQKEIPYEFDGKVLKVPFTNGVETISLEYEYQSDVFLRSGFELITYLVPYIYSSNSWYFTCDNMQIDSVKVNIPNDLCFFANLPIQKNDKQLLLLTDNLENNNITFFTLRKEFYTYSAFTYKNITVNLLQTSGAVLLDSSDFIPGIPNKKLQAERVKIAKNAIKRISRFLKIDRPLQITIADRNLTKKDVVGWATTCHSTNNDSFVLIDNSMWDDNGIFHELIHAFDHKALMKSNTDSAAFFFAESLPEYFSVCLKYKNKEERDAILGNKILAFARSKNEQSSIMGLEQSNLRVGGGTGFIVYYKTPFLIHEFVKSIGEKRFWKAFDDFYKEVQQRDKISFKDFERVMKAHGVTDQQWDWFLWYL